MFIGKIVSASSHIDYVCQVLSSGEADVVPAPTDYGFGQYVAIEAADGSSLVGLIHNTTLLNPEFGNLGPRLSPREDLAVFAPDYLTEQATLVAILVVGRLDAQMRVQQGVPTIAANPDARVRALARNEVIAFHRATGGLQVAYLPLLAGLQSPLAPSLLEHTLTQLGALFPTEEARLNVLRANVAWRSRILPTG